jgi:hypothetical protein
MWTDSAACLSAGSGDEDPGSLLYTKDEEVLISCVTNTFSIRIIKSGVSCTPKLSL